MLPLSVLIDLEVVFDLLTFTRFHVMKGNRCCGLLLSHLV